MMLLLLLVGGLLIAVLLLPVVAIIRAASASAEAARLRARVAILEQQVLGLTAARQSPDAQAPDPAVAGGRELRSEELGPTQVTAAAGPLAVGSGDADVPADGGPRVGTPLELAGDRPAVFEATSEHATALPAEADTGGTRADAVEEAIGGRLLLYVGTLVLVLGVAFFLRYAFDRDWIGERARVLMGAATGAALVGSGLRFIAEGYALYGQILAGGGLAALYLSIYAAFSFYGLIGGGAAFALLLGVTVATAWLADRQRSQGMAVMAAGGGFLTPFLVGGGTDAQVTLFSYLALLIAGTLFLARRRGWPLLNVLAYTLTILSVLAWADRFYTSRKYLVTEGFLTLFCVMFMEIARQATRGSARVSRLTAGVLWTAPIVYHLASIAILGRRTVPLLVYLIAVSLVGIVLAIRHGSPLIRLGLWFGVFLPLAGWVEGHQGRTWAAPGLVTIAALFVMHLAAQVERALRQDETLDPPDLLLMHANGLGAFLSAWVLLERESLGLVPYVGAVLVGAHAIVSRWLHTRDSTAALHALAVGFTLVAATVAVQMDGAWMTAALAAEGAAVVWVGLRVDRWWFRAGGAALLAVAAARWVLFSAAEPPARFTPVLHETFALGAWIVALLYSVAWLHRRFGSGGRYHQAIASLLVAASAMTVAVLSVENAWFWNLRGDTSADATFAAGLSLSVIWAGYAGVAALVGIRRRYAPLRYVAIGLFGLTILKVFLFDLSQLEGIYRVVGLVIVGSVLLLVSFLYQRGRTRSAPE